jgi:hypothetical protein
MYSGKIAVPPGGGGIRKLGKKQFKLTNLIVDVKLPINYFPALFVTMNAFQMMHMHCWVSALFVQ